MYLISFDALATSVVYSFADTPYEYDETAPGTAGTIESAAFWSDSTVYNFMYLTLKPSWDLWPNAQKGGIQPTNVEHKVDKILFAFGIYWNDRKRDFLLKGSLKHKERFVHGNDLQLYFSMDNESSFRNDKRKYTLGFDIQKKDAIRLHFLQVNLTNPYSLGVQLHWIAASWIKVLWGSLGRWKQIDHFEIVKNSAKYEQESFS